MLSLQKNPNNHLKNEKFILGHLFIQQTFTDGQYIWSAVIHAGVSLDSLE